MKRRYFLDFEFMEDGKTIEPLSIGVVDNLGREFYAVFAEADHSKANDWVKQHVLPHLGTERVWSKVLNEIMLSKGLLADSFPTYWKWLWEVGEG